MLVQHVQAVLQLELSIAIYTSGFFWGGGEDFAVIFYLLQKQSLQRENRVLIQCQNSLK